METRSPFKAGTDADRSLAMLSEIDHDRSPAMPPASRSLSDPAQALFDFISSDNDTDALAMLSIVKDVNECDRGRATALHLVCQRGRAALIKPLLERKANVAFVGPDGRTPLHYLTLDGGCVGSKIELLKIILEWAPRDQMPEAMRLPAPYFFPDGLVHIGFTELVYQMGEKAVLTLLLHYMVSVCMERDSISPSDFFSRDTDGQLFEFTDSVFQHCRDDLAALRAAQTLRDLDQARDQARLLKEAKSVPAHVAAAFHQEELTRLRRTIKSRMMEPSPSPSPSQQHDKDEKKMPAKGTYCALPLVGKSLEPSAASSSSQGSPKGYGASQSRAASFGSSGKKRPRGDEAAPSSVKQAKTNEGDSAKLPDDFAELDDLSQLAAAPKPKSQFTTPQKR